MKIASIDIGTNTVLMLVGNKNSVNTPIQIIGEFHNIGKLGENLVSTGFISSDAIFRVSEILREYISFCADNGVHHIAVTATSALREAKNQSEVQKIFESIIGVPLKIISGDEEARLTFAGSVETEKRATLVDIGGGSTEIVTGEQQTIHYARSFLVGAVRLSDMFFPQLPPAPLNVGRAKDFIVQTIKNANFSQPGEFIGVGGTFTTLAAMDLELSTFAPEKVHGHKLYYERLLQLNDYLFSSSHRELLNNPAIHPKRADILPAGALILQVVLELLQANSCICSTKGLRYGVLYEAFDRYFASKTG